MTMLFAVLAALPCILAPPALAQESEAPAPAAPTGIAPLDDNAGDDRPSLFAPVPGVDTPSGDAMPAEASGSRPLPRDLSPWGMFLKADRVVQGVMIGLAAAFFLTWTVWLAKALEVAGAKARARRALRAVLEAGSLGEAAALLAERGGPGAFMVRAAAEELSRSAGLLEHAGTAGVKERVVSRLSRIEARAGRRLARGTGLLATIGATAPFVGLFGTVWGIMNAFIGISRAQTTNLAVVAPGIAEALLATAMGLAAAIPAVVIYNGFARAIAGYRQGLADIGAGLERLVSRDLDERARPASHGPGQAPAAAE